MRPHGCPPTRGGGAQGHRSAKSLRADRSLSRGECKEQGLAGLNVATPSSPKRRVKLGQREQKTSRGAGEERLQRVGESGCGVGTRSNDISGPTVGVRWLLLLQVGLNMLYAVHPPFS